MADRITPKDPGYRIAGAGVWFTVASPNHPNYPTGTIVGGPYNKDNAPRPRRGEPMADWVARRYAAGFIDKIMPGITEAEFEAQFLTKFHVIKGSEAMDKVSWTSASAETAKEIAGPKGRVVDDFGRLG